MHSSLSLPLLPSPHRHDPCARLRGEGARGRCAAGPCLRSDLQLGEAVDELGDLVQRVERPLAGVQPAEQALDGADRTVQRVEQLRYRIELLAPPGGEDVFQGLADGLDVMYVHRAGRPLEAVRLAEDGVDDPFAQHRILGPLQFQQTGRDGLEMLLGLDPEHRAKLRK